LYFKESKPRLNLYLKNFNENFKRGEYLMALYRIAAVFTVVSIILCMCTCSNTPAFNIEETVNKWVAMWNSYDLSQVDNLFITDSSVTYFSSEKEGVIKGIEALREHHKGFGFVEGGKAQENKLWLKDIHTGIYGSTAVVTGIWLFQRASDPPGKVQRGPVTMVYVYKDNEYRIAHMNFGNYESEEK